MAFLYSFSDDVLYGTDDINSITARLMGAGVSPFAKKESYSTSELNLLTKAVVRSGVQLDGCMCEIRDIGGSNEVSVGQGAVFFENGATMDVDSEGYQISVPYDTEGFVYAFFDAGIQVADILFSKELPSSSYYVLLAKVNSDNTVTDKRVFARSKVATFGANIAYTTEFVTHDPVLYEQLQTGYPNPFSHYKIGAIDVDISNFNYALVQNSGDKSNGGIGGIFDIKASEFVFSVDWTDPPSWNTNYMYYGSGGVYYGMDVVDGRLCLIAGCEVSQSKYIDTSSKKYIVTLM